MVDYSAPCRRERRANHAETRFRDIDDSEPESRAIGALVSDEAQSIKNGRKRRVIHRLKLHLAPERFEIRAYVGLPDLVVHHGA